MVKKEERYFIALIPPEPLFSEASDLKKYVKEHFNSKAALRSPPHITLHMPFRLKPNKEEQLDLALSDFASKHDCFEVIQDGFGFFEPRVVFINVQRSLEMSGIQKSLLSFMKRNFNTDSQNYKDRGFTPHMTIAFRDLKKELFEEAKAYFEKKKISFQWTASELVLLRHDGMKWNIYKKYSLKMNR
ncbi:MAG: 2'-5' RNA ligase family protein [Cyclobacteriaceae bacterium]